MNVGSLKKFLKDIDDDIELRVVNNLKILSSVKHIHLADYINDKSDLKMLVFCPMGNHLPDTLNLKEGTH